MYSSKSLMSYLRHRENKQNVYVLNINTYYKYKHIIIKWWKKWECYLSTERWKGWSGLPLPSPGDLYNPGIETASLASPALAGGFLTTGPPGKPTNEKTNKTLNIYKAWLMSSLGGSSVTLEMAVQLWHSLCPRNIDKILNCSAD